MKSGVLMRTRNRGFSSGTLGPNRTISGTHQQGYNFLGRAKSVSTGCITGISVDRRRQILQGKTSTYSGTYSGMRLVQGFVINLLKL